MLAARALSGARGGNGRWTDGGGRMWGLYRTGGGGRGNGGEVRKGGVTITHEYKYSVGRGRAPVQRTRRKSEDGVHSGAVGVTQQGSWTLAVGLLSLISQDGGD